MAPPSTTRALVASLALIGGCIAADSYVQFTSFSDCTNLCTFGQHALPLPGQGFGEGGYAIFTTYDYSISYVNADPAFPLQLTWYIPIDERAGGTLGAVRWTQNISNPKVNDTLVWSPREVLLQFPNAHSNWTDIEALGYASKARWTNLGISQPGKLFGGSDITILSTPFLLFPRIFEELFEDRYEQGQISEFNMWKLGVGVGVGVGVPLLVIAAGVLGFLFGKKRSANREKPLKA